MTQRLRQNSACNNAGTRSSSLGSLRRVGTSNAPRLSLFLPREHGLENPPRTAAAMDNILHMMQVAWRQISAARGSTVKLANPEHNLLMSLESAREFMLGMLREPDPGRRHLEDVFGVRAILDAVKLSTRVMGDERVISCMNAVKSVECVLKDCGAAVRLSEAQDKELKKMQRRQMRFEARHLRGEFSPLKSNRMSCSAFGMEDELGRAGGEPYSRPRSASTSAIEGHESVASALETWKVLRDAWESGSFFQEGKDVKKLSAVDNASSSSEDGRGTDHDPNGAENGQVLQASPVEEVQNQCQSVTDASVDNAMTCDVFTQLGHNNADVMLAGSTYSMEEQRFDEGLSEKAIKADASKTVKTQSQKAEDTLQCLDAEDDFAVKAPRDVTESDSDDVPMPENWGMQRQKRGSLIRPVQLPAYLLEHARLAGYGDSGCDVVEFQVAHHEEKIGIAFRILPPAGHLVVERITPGSPAEALQLPKGSRLLCVNGLHTGSIEADNFFSLMKQRPLQLLFLRPAAVVQ